MSSKRGKEKSESESNPRGTAPRSRSQSRTRQPRGLSQSASQDVLTQPPQVPIEIEHEQTEHQHKENEITETDDQTRQHELEHEQDIYYVTPSELERIEQEQQRRQQILQKQEALERQQQQQYRQAHETDVHQILKQLSQQMSTLHHDVAQSQKQSEQSIQTLYNQVQKLEQEKHYKQLPQPSALHPAQKNATYSSSTLPRNPLGVTKQEMQYQNQPQYQPQHQYQSQHQPQYQGQFQPQTPTRNQGNIGVNNPKPVDGLTPLQVVQYVKLKFPAQFTNDAKFTTGKFESFRSEFLNRAQTNGYVEFITTDSQVLLTKILASVSEDIGLNHHVTRQVYDLYRKTHAQICGVIKACVANVYSNTMDLEERMIKTFSTEGYVDTSKMEFEQKYVCGGLFSDNNAYLLFKTIEQQHRLVTSYTFISIIKRLISFKFTTTGDLESEWVKFNMIIDELNEAARNKPALHGHVLPEVIEATFALNALPSEWETLVTQSVTAKVDQTKDDVYQSMSRMKTATKMKTKTSTALYSNRQRINAYADNRYVRGQNGTMYDTRRRKWLKQKQANKSNSYRNSSYNNKRSNYRNQNSNDNYQNKNNRNLSLLVEDENMVLFGSEDLNTNQMELDNYEEITEEEYNQLNNDQLQEYGIEIEQTDRTLVVMNICENIAKHAEEEDANSDESEESEQEMDLKNKFKLTTQDTIPELFNQGTFIIDSGSTAHICGYPEQLIKGHKPLYKQRVKGLYNESHQVTGIGTVPINYRLQINNVLLVPSARCNLISVSQLAKSDVITVFTKKGGYMRLGSDVFLRFEKVNDLYIYRDPTFKIKPVEKQKTIEVRSSQKAKPAKQSTVSEEKKESKTKEPSTKLSIMNDEESSAEHFDYGFKAWVYTDYGTNIITPNTEQMLLMSKEETVKPNKLEMKIINDPSELYQIHQKMGHRTLTKPLLNAMNFDSSTDAIIQVNKECETCNKTKIISVKTGKGTYVKATKPFQKLSYDIIGPFSYKIENERHDLLSPSGCKYLLTVICNFSRYCWCFPIVSKSDSAEYIMKLITKINNQFPATKVQTIHSDGAKEFNTKALLTFCDKLGIEKTVSPPYMPNLNGAIERLNRTIITITKALLYFAGLNQQLFAEASKYAAIIHNNTPVKSLSYQTPAKTATGHQMNMKRLHIFGSSTYVIPLSPNEMLGKFQEKTITGIFVGYDTSASGMKILTENYEIMKTRNVKIIDGNFDNIQKLGYQSTSNVDIQVRNDMETHEESPPNDEFIQDDSLIYPVPLIPNQLSPIEITEDNIHDIDNITLDTPLSRYQPDLSTVQEERSIDISQHSNEPENIISSLPHADIQTRTGRSTITPSRYGMVDYQRELDPISRYEFSKLMVNHEQGETISLHTTSKSEMFESIESESEEIKLPVSFTEALKGDHAKEWLEATNAEMDQIKKRNTFVQISPDKVPKSVKPLKCRMVYVTKKDKNNNIIKWKSRLVIKGYSQRPNIDYDVLNISSPVCKITTLYTVLAISVQLKHKLRVIDFSNAFLHSDIDTEIYISLPPDIAKHYFKINHDKHNLFKLIKALYGLRQSPILWYKTLKQFLIELGYQPLVIDCCVFIKFTDTTPIIVCIYVDDTIISMSELNEKIWFNDLEQIKLKFELKDLGMIDKVLGINVNHDHHHQTLTLSQEPYVKTLLTEFKLTPKQVTNPIANDTANIVNEQIYTKGNELNQKEQAMFRSIIGALSYLSSRTRPDISFIVNLLSRFCNQAYEAHLTAAVRVIQYVDHTKHFCITFKHDPNIMSYDQYKIVASCDASHGNNMLFKSTLAYMISVNNNVIGWASTKSKVPSLSSTESEYYALTLTTQEVLYTRAVIHEILNVQIAPIISIDNRAAIEIASNIRHFKRTKHINIKFHFIKFYVDNKTISIKWIPTNKNVADFLTKRMNTKQFHKLINSILTT
jgi:transposase InsO family protein